MPEIPLLRPAQVVAAFRRLGWEVARRRGSHIILAKPGHIASLSVPIHPQVARGTLRSLIQMSGVSVDEFLSQTK